MTTMTLLEPPPFLRRAGLTVAAAMVGFVVVTAFVPWRQSARGEGQVVAYFPHEREQGVDAPIDGRIAKWMVIEGARVAAGDPLVEIIDVDPLYATRVVETRDVALERVAASDARVRAVEEEIAASEEARTRRVEAAALRVDMARQSLIAAEEKARAAEVAFRTARQNEERVRTLTREGLTSTREVEVAELASASAEAEAAMARARVAEAMAAVEGAEAERLRTDADAIATIAKARGELKKANADRASARGEVVRAETEISRQSARLVTAPAAGTVLRVHGQQGGRIVKRGDPLCVIVPDTDDLAAELFVDGNDAPLVVPGQAVRVQIEGWPAVQLAGWPEVAVGTFGGLVAFIDAQGREDGRVRVVVRPDPDEAPWPEKPFLRQGVRALGWVLLGEVTIGYEVWRRLNGFPVDRTAARAAQDAAKGGKGGGK